MIRKRNLLIIALLLAALALAACGRDSEPTPEELPPTAAPEPTATPEPAQPAEAAPAETEAVTETEAATTTETTTETEETGETAQAVEVAPTVEITVTEELTETEAGAMVESTPQMVTALQVESARAVSDILDDNNAAIMNVSPDGRYIAYVTYSGRGRNRAEDLCIFEFENATPTCYPRPVATDTAPEYMGYPYQLVWSPDSTMIAFTENPYQLGYESDVWVFDVATGVFTDRTNDGVTGSYAGLEPGSYFLDYLPMWDQPTGDLIFWRSIPQGNLTSTMQLMRVNPREGDPVELHDFTTELAGLFFAFDYQYWFMDGPSYISPDGTKIAMLPSPIDSTTPISTEGVWIANISPGVEGAWSRQVATIEDMQVAMPAWQQPEADPVAVQWTADSKGFVVLAVSNNIQQPMLLFYYFDAETGKSEAVVNFSDVASYEDYMSLENELGVPPRYYSPWTATVSPKGQQLMMIQDLGGVAAVLVSPLPPDGKVPAVAWDAETNASQSDPRSSVAKDGKVLIYATLLTTTEE